VGNLVTQAGIGPGNGHQIVGGRFMSLRPLPPRRQISGRIPRRIVYRIVAHPAKGVQGAGGPPFIGRQQPGGQIKRTTMGGRQCRAVAVSPLQQSGILNRFDRGGHHRMPRFVGQ
jgi:hypothetical protein